MRKILSMALLAIASMTLHAQTDVTDKYIENADFGARFAAWSNPGKFAYSVADNFAGKHGEVWMEKWVAKGSTLGTNGGMYQTLRNMPTGTYTLTVSAQNVSQSNTNTKCTGAFVYAGNEQVEINQQGQYSVVFTVVNGKADIGVRLKNCNGNWVCVDNFRLYYNGENADSVAAEQARVDQELADLKEHLANPTGTIPTVKTSTFVATGTTIALGRSTVSGSCKEKGFCWSTEPEPTIFDERTTETFENNGSIYVMRGLKPSTIYYVRAYAMTSGYQVAYGDVVKIATLRKGVMSYGYDFNGDAAQNARINSASAECIWMYNALSYIPGFYLNVHYVYGAGAGDGTADCSYGGWMRVSQKEAYQQTGTILHETNHGVGVGTTNEWYNNSNLRAETTRGLWLGPRATEMVRFFDNNTTSTMTGDGTHMWPYGINGAHEDSYQPSNHALYFANILITHAMHQDGLICSSQAGFAMPAYVFQQDDEKKYYIKCEDSRCGGLTSYLGMSSTGALKSYELSAEEALQNDDYAWQITFDPKTSNYVFYNIGQGKYLTYNSESRSIKAVKKSTPATTEKFQLMPSRGSISVGDFSGTSFWVLSGTDHMAMQGSSTYSSSNATYNVTTAAYNASNSSVAQRWIFLTADQASLFDQAAVNAAMDDLNKAIQNVKNTISTPHISNTVDATVETIDNTLNGVVEGIESAKDGFTSPSQVKEAIGQLNDALLSFLSDVRISDEEVPFDLSFLLVNAAIDNDCNGWSSETTVNYSCAEFFEKSFDFNQTTSLKVPAGTYTAKVQAFQRTGSNADAYTEYKAGTNNVKAQFYVKAKNVPIKNIFDDAQATSLGTGSVAVATKVYVPNNMQSASAFFKKNLYDNELTLATTSSATMKIGIKNSSSSTAWWTIFDNFRLYYHGDLTKVIEDGIQLQSAEETDDSKLYDLSGRQITGKPQRGIYVKNGKKQAF